MYGYLRVAALMPDVKVGNPKLNIESIREVILKANTLSVKLCLLPELCISSNNLQSLYFDRNIINDSLNALFSLLAFSSDLDMIIIVSLPFEINSNIYEVSAVIKSGKILGMIPKFIFSSNECNKEYFSNVNIKYDNYTIYDNERNCTFSFPISKDLIFNTTNYNFKIIFNSKVNNNVRTNIICNIESIPETIDIDTKIREVKMLSDYNKCAIITATPGTSESTEQYAYFGRSFICENGEVIVKNDIITNSMLISDIDIDKMHTIFNNNINDDNNNIVNFNYTNFIYNNIGEKLFRDFDKTPYINKKVNPYNYSMHIINIIAIALAKRIKVTKSSCIVIGISGGLDSTIALLIAKKTTEFLSIGNDAIKAIFMPGLGTSSNSINNVSSLLNSLNIKINTIDIKNAVLEHFANIDHDQNDINITYENSQARERTQILMDIANDCNGIVIGTGDLSEIALGYSTYNGDQMSMYNVNGSLPKTLIRYILNSIANENIKTNNNIMLANSIKNILHNKISPELLPTDGDVVSQNTEEILGDFEIHDFLLYNYLKYNFDYAKLLDLSLRTFVYNSFENNYSEEYIKNCINIFFSRFYKSQFKRTASPPSLDIGLPNLNSHFSFKMPSDIEFSL